MSLKIGDKVKDLTTGLKGHVVEIIQYATGCTSYGFKPLRPWFSIKTPETLWVDKAQMKLLKSGNLALFQTDDQYERLGNSKYGFGDKLKDRVTGFEGIVLGKNLLPTGCIHYGLSSPELKDGHPGDWYWMDTTRLELVEEQSVTFTESEEFKGTSPERAFNPPQS